MPYSKDTYIKCPACGKEAYNYWEEEHLDVMGVFFHGEPDVDEFVETGVMAFNKKESWYAKHQSAWKILCGEPIRIDYPFLPSDMQDWLENNPEVFIQTVIDLFWFKFYDDAEAMLPPVEKEDISATVVNLPEYLKIPLPEVKLPKHQGKLRIVEGIVVGVTEPYSIYKKKAYTCAICGTKRVVEIDDTNNSKSIRCKNCGKTNSMKFDEEASEEYLIPCQKLMLQESQTKVLNTYKLTITLREKTIEDFDPDKRKYIAGNEVAVVLIPRQFPDPKSNKAISNPKAINVEIIKKSFDELTEIPKDFVERIKKLHKASDNPTCSLIEDDDGNRSLVAGDLLQSFCPDIYGMWNQKLAILLQLFGGSKGDDAKRSNVHVLMIGDPSTAKTSFMKYVSDVSPRGIYAVASQATKVGLTATVFKSSEGDWTVEAGALVLANGGICSIDEFGQMKGEDTYALYEAMEQQTVSIHKANIHATLPAKTAILAGMNPKFGRLSPNEPLISQIDIHPPLFERFDLKFLIRDIPNPNLDMKIADRIFDREADNVDVLYDRDFIRAYIAYARQNFNPDITDKVRNKIVSFYKKLREQSHDMGGDMVITISPRELNTLIRLTQAVAKMNLRKVTTIEDAEIAIWLLRQSLGDLGFEITSVGDILKFQLGATKEEIVIQDRKTRLLKLVPFKPDLIDRNDLIDLAEEKGIDKEWAEKTIDKLKHQGLIYEPRPMQYRRMGT